MLSKTELRFFQAFSLLFFFLIIYSCGSQTGITPGPEKVPEKTQQVTFIYEEDFSDEEKVKLEEWIRFTSDAAQRVLGEFPFDLYYHFHREDSAGMAVLFGHTARTDSINAAHFYVDPTYSLDDLKADWIAPHEISHLALPKLDKTDMWFFEGFATYMSRQVMIETGALNKAEVDSINLARIRGACDKFETTSLLAAVADSLKSAHNWPPVYWIGASFFDQADKKLQLANKGSLTDVVKEFQACCHVTSMTTDEVIASFDKISRTSVFSELYTYYTTTPCNQILAGYNESTPTQ